MGLCADLHPLQVEASQMKGERCLNPWVVGSPLGPRACLDIGSWPKISAKYGILSYGVVLSPISEWFPTPMSGFKG